MNHMLIYCVLYKITNYCRKKTVHNRLTHKFINTTFHQQYYCRSSIIRRVISAFYNKNEKKKILTHEELIIDRKNCSVQIAKVCHVTIINDKTSRNKRAVHKWRQELSFAEKVYTSTTPYTVFHKTSRDCPPTTFLPSLHHRSFLAQTREKVYICPRTKFHPDPRDARASVLSRDGQLLRLIPHRLLIRIFINMAVRTFCTSYAAQK